MVSLSDKLASTVQDAVKLARSGHQQSARQTLWQIVSVDPTYEHAWLALAYVSQNTEEKRAALWKALALNPAHERVKNAFLKLCGEPHMRAGAKAGVFISYAHSDELLAADIAEDLRFVGVPVWIDIMDMPDGDDWHEAVTAAMRRAGLMLVIGSPGALRSNGVQAEVRQFMDAGKIVLPLLAQSCDLSGLGLWQTPIDFRADYTLGLQNLLRLLTPEPARV